MFDRPRLNKLVAWRLLGSVEPNAGNAPPALTPAPWRSGSIKSSAPPCPAERNRRHQALARSAARASERSANGQRRALQPPMPPWRPSRRRTEKAIAGHAHLRWLARAEVRYGFMERREHSGGAGGGGGEALGAALDRDEALPRRSPVGRFLPFVARHLAPHR